MCLEIMFATVENSNYTDGKRNRITSTSKLLHFYFTFVEQNVSIRMCEEPKMNNPMFY